MRPQGYVYIKLPKSCFERIEDDWQVVRERKYQGGARSVARLHHRVGEVYSLRQDIHEWMVKRRRKYQVTYYHVEYPRNPANNFYGVSMHHKLAVLFKLTWGGE